MRKPDRWFRLAGWMLLLVCLFLVADCSGAERQPRNVILMIADGAGFNSFDAASYYQYGRLGCRVYDEFPVRLACSTWSLDGDEKPQGYDPVRAWSSFEALTANPTDSAAAATALCTGVKTTNGRICTDKNGRNLKNITQIARRQGMRAGVVTSVIFSDATPACMGATNTSRNNAVEIANEMIFGGLLDVIIGCGHPDYDKNAKPLAADAKRDYKYVGDKDTWDALQSGRTGEGWTLVTDLEQFEAIAADPAAAPARLIGVARVKGTLQKDRSGKESGELNSGVPNLATMSLAALNTLARGEHGFVLMIEGGAVDWANHANNLARMIEEQVDFNLAVDAVVKWIEVNGGWDRTLLIITADHETGHLWGSGSGPPATFNPLVNNGQGKLPGAEYHSGGHTNSLVPLYAKGPGCEMFTKLIVGEDPRYGRYVDNTDVFKVMKTAVMASEIIPQRLKTVVGKVNP